MFTMPPTNAAGQPSVVSVVASPAKADGSPSKAVLSGLTFTSSDPTIFTVAPDPTTPNGAVVTAVAQSGTATLSATATATEPDGKTTESISGSADISIAAAAPAPAASLTLTFGTPA